MQGSEGVRPAAAFQPIRKFSSISAPSPMACVQRSCSCVRVGSAKCQHINRDIENFVFVYLYLLSYSANFPCGYSIQQLKCMFISDKVCL